LGTTTHEILKARFLEGDLPVQFLIYLRKALSVTDDDERFLAETVLDAHEWRGIGELANAISIFEPLNKRGNLGEVVADRLVALGLAEKGRSSDRYFAIGLTVGYRLSPLGWKVKDRGRFPRHRRST
jgi:hypothetical protein